MFSVVIFRNVFLYAEMRIICLPFALSSGIYLLTGIYLVCYTDDSSNLPSKACELLRPNSWFNLDDLVAA